MSQESQSKFVMNQDLGSICTGDVVAINKSFDHVAAQTTKNNNTSQFNQIRKNDEMILRHIVQEKKRKE